MKGSKKGTLYYDGLGDRHQQNPSTGSGTGVNYTLDLAAGLTQVLSDGTNTYLYGNGRISQNTTQAEYFLGDALGSVRQLADSAGAVTLTQSYAPYGETISSVGTGASVYQFTGESRDANGLTYLRARYYNSGDGRFLSRDTWSGVYSSPQSLNRWNYTESNPVNYTDPSGNYCIAGFDVDFLGGDKCTNQEREETVRKLNYLHGYISSPNFVLGAAYEIVDAALIVGPETARLAWSFMLKSNPTLHNLAQAIAIDATLCGNDTPSILLDTLMKGVSNDTYFMQERATGRMLAIAYAMNQITIGGGGTVVAAALGPFSAGFSLAATPVTVAISAHGAAVLGSVALKEWNDHLIYNAFTGNTGGGVDTPFGPLHKPGKGPDIALGMTSPKNGTGVVKFARDKNAKWYEEWLESRLVSGNTPSFSSEFESAMLRTNKAHFSLDGLGWPNANALRNAIKRGSTGIKLGNYTNWELHQVLNNQNWYNKTTFYFQGSPVSIPFGGP